MRPVRNYWPLLFAVLASSTGISAWQAVRANARAAAEWDSLQAEIRLRGQAEHSESNARENSRLAETTLAFIIERVFGAGRMADSESKPAHDITIREALNMADADASTMFRNSPEEEVWARHNLAKCMAQCGDYHAEAAQFERIVNLKRMSQGPNHVEVLMAANDLAVAYANSGSLDRAIQLLQDVCQRLESQSDPAHREILRPRENLACMYLASGRPDSAIPIFDELLRQHQTGDPQTLVVISNLAVAHDMVGNYARAEQLFTQSLSGHRRVLGPQDVQTIDTQAFYGRTLLHQGKYAETYRVLRDCVELSTRKKPSWHVFYYRSLLGAALVGQAVELQLTDSAAANEMFRTAEKELVTANIGLQRYSATVPFQHKNFLPEVIERLVELYTAWDKPEEAARWQQEIDEQKKRLAPTSKAQS